MKGKVDTLQGTVKVLCIILAIFAIVSVAGLGVAAYTVTKDNSDDGTSGGNVTEVRPNSNDSGYKIYKPINFDLFIVCLFYTQVSQSLVLKRIRRETIIHVRVNSPTSGSHKNATPLIEMWTSSLDHA